MLWNICMLFGLGDEESPRLPVDIPSHTRPAIPGGLRSRIARFRFTGWGKDSCETVRESSGFLELRLDRKGRTRHLDVENADQPAFSGFIWPRFPPYTRPKTVQITPRGSELSIIYSMHPRIHQRLMNGALGKRVAGMRRLKKVIRLGISSSSNS